MKTNTVSYVVQPPQVTGNVVVPDNITMISPKMQAGQNVEISTGGYANNKNVPVDLTFNGISNTVNCTYVSHRWSLNNGTTFVDTDPCTIQPSTKALLLITLANPSMTMGQTDVTASFDVDVTITNHIA
jgi:hypothetical protein